MTKPLPPRTTQAAADIVTAETLGAWLGIATRGVGDLARRGILVKVERRGFDLRASVRGYCDHLRRALIGRGGERLAATTAAEHGRLAKAQADAVELRNARARGELVLAADVVTEWSGVLRTVRAGMLAVPSRCASRLPHLSVTDVSEIDAEVRAVLSEVAGTKGGC